MERTKSRFDISESYSAHAKTISQEEQLEMLRHLKTLEPKSPEWWECRAAIAASCYMFLLKAAYLKRNKRVHRDDLLQAGAIGLTRAIDNFDTERGVKFLTYAGIAITRRMSLEMDMHWSIVRSRRSDRRLVGAVLYRRVVLSQELGRKPTFDELLEFTGISEYDLRAVMALTSDFRLEFRKGRNGDEFGELGDSIGVEDDIEGRTEFQEESDLLLDRLRRFCSDRTMDILSSRWGLNGKPETLEQIGDRLGITRERVRQIEEKGILRLHKMLLQNGYKQIDADAKAFKQRLLKRLHADVCQSQKLAEMEQVA